MRAVGFFFASNNLRIEDGPAQTHPSDQNTSGATVKAREMRLAAVEYHDSDIYADLWVRRQQVDDRQEVSVQLPIGHSIQVKLQPPMGEGHRIRLKGHGVDGNGDLYLRVRLEQ